MKKIYITTILLVLVLIVGFLYYNFALNNTLTTQKITISAQNNSTSSQTQNGLTYEQKFDILSTTVSSSSAKISDAEKLNILDSAKPVNNLTDEQKMQILNGAK